MALVDYIDEVLDHGDFIIIELINLSFMNQYGIISGIQQKVAVRRLPVTEEFVVLNYDSSDYFSPYPADRSRIFDMPTKHLVIMRSSKVVYIVTRDDKVQTVSYDMPHSQEYAWRDFYYDKSPSWLFLES